MAAAWLGLGSAGVAEPAAPPRYAFCAFTKFVQSFSFDQLGEAVSQAGFPGVEAPVRQGGHFTMEEAPEKLPTLVETLRQHKVEVTILCTDVLRADQPHAEPCLRTAAKLGVKRYRMGFYRYDLAKSVTGQLAEIGPAIRDLAALNRELGLQAVYQNHSGADMVGAAVWDFYRLIEDVPSDEVALAFDIRHATIEAGLAWPATFNAVRPHIGAVFVKDFDWDGRRARHVPLGQGRVDPKFFSMLNSSGFAGPISVHVEYLPRGGAAANAQALKTDFATLQRWLGA
jgi:sugar phosphate isomerase/epimerase